MALLLNDIHYFNNNNKFQRWTLLPCTLSSWLCLQLFLHLVFIQSGMLVVVGLRLESISVPQSGIKGGSVTLGCEYRVDGDGEKLYSLKWYKDSHEFFRYTPQGPTPITTFNLPGVQVDSSDYRTLTPNRVIFKLKNLRISSGGTYKCEISADAPTFKTLSKESNLTVIVLPNPPKPVLKTFPPNGGHLQMGERIRGNCSFSRSFPPATLTFFVNGAKVNESVDIKLKEYEPRVDGVIEDYNWSGGSSSMTGVSSSNGIGKQYQHQQQHQQISSSYNTRDNTMMMNLGTGGGVDGIGIGMSGGGKKMTTTTMGHTYTSVMGIEIRVVREYFRSRGQLLNILCRASVVDQIWDTQINITIQNYQPPQLSTSGQNRYSAGAESHLFRPSFMSSRTPLHCRILNIGIFTMAWSILLF